MAGIGFELKKLFKKEGLLSNLRAYLYSIFVTVGPVVISVIAITFMKFLLTYIGVARYDIEILQGTIMYSFIFSVILSSGYCMVLSRYLSDRLYMKKEEDILPALYGSLSVMIFVSGVIGVIFYFPSPMNDVYRFFSYLLFVELTIQMVLNTYISAVKNFRKVAFSFLYGTIVAAVIGYLLIRYTVLDEILAVLIAFDLCFFLVIVLLTFEIQQYFGRKSTLYFNFIKYFRNFRMIFFTNLFYFIGFYAHSFVFWSFPETNHIIENTYVYSPVYDIPSFYAFLSIIPTMVIFIVKIETAFYEKYKNYFFLVNNGACLEDVEVAKREMKRSIYKELIYIMEIQLFFTIAFIILGRRFLPLSGFTASMIDMYSIISLGYYCFIIMFVVMTILLYYDNQKNAFWIALIFMTTSFLFALVTIHMGENYYGTGFFIAALLSLILAINRLKNYLDNIEYYVFCIQVSWKERDRGCLDAFIDGINEIGG